MHIVPSDAFGKHIEVKRKVFKNSFRKFEKFWGNKLDLLRGMKEITFAVTIYLRYIGEKYGYTSEVYKNAKSTFSANEKEISYTVINGRCIPTILLPESCKTIIHE